MKAPVPCPALGVDAIVRRLHSFMDGWCGVADGPLQFGQDSLCERVREWVGAWLWELARDSFWEGVLTVWLTMASVIPSADGMIFWRAARIPGARGRIRSVTKAASWGLVAFEA